MVYKAPFSDMRLSISGKYLLAGTVDGMTCIRKIKLEDMILAKWEKGHEDYSSYASAYEAELEKEGEDKVTESEDRGQYWLGHVHDCERGKVNSVVLTFDDSFLISCGNDGGLFVWRVLREPIKKSEGTVTFDVKYAIQHQLIYILILIQPLTQTRWITH
jgi:WD40 repeat protein